MNPELELFLQQAFAGVEASSSAIGRVIVEPDYEAKLNETDGPGLAKELAELVKSQPPLQNGHAEVEIPANFSLLGKYVRRIILHTERVEESWVEVEPPGNWI